jgi:hypothetical protein
LSLLDIFHFLLGGNREPASPLSAAELAEDSFCMTFDVLGNKSTATRSIANPGRIEIGGDYSRWPLRPDVDEANGLVTMTTDAWCDLLGRAFFGLPPASTRSPESLFPSEVVYPTSLDDNATMGM